MIKNIANALLNLNSQQRKMIYTMLFGSTGPVVWFLTKKMGYSSEEANMLLQWFAGFTMIAAGIILPAFATNKAAVNSIATMAPAEKAAAFAAAPAEVKVQAAATVPGTTVIVDPAVAPLAATAVAHDPDQQNVVSTGERR